MHRIIDLAESDNGILYKSHLEKLTKLELKSADTITDLTGLEYAINLVSLDLSNQNSCDLSYLKKMTFTKIILSDTKNIAALSDKKNTLTTLEIWRGDLSNSDITALSDFKALKRLVLRFHAISDVTPLEGLSKLEYLDLTYNLISDLSPLKSCSKLKTLKLWDNAVEDLNQFLDWPDRTITIELRNNPVPGGDHAEILEELLDKGITVTLE